MKAWQRISLVLIALVLCFSLLGLGQWGGVAQPDVSWNSRVVYQNVGPQPDVSWNSRMAYLYVGPQPNVSWNS